jgi:glycosyltransferase involved in cell wall biosynthesis
MNTDTQSQLVPESPLTTSHPHIPIGPTVALIPAYNEERFIGSLVLAVLSYVDQVIVIDDGSSDNTVAIAEKAGATVVRHTQNKGKAAAVNTGFNYVRTLNPRALVMLDGDGQHCADDIPTVLEPVMSADADIVIGSRFLKIKNDIPVYRQVGQHSLTITTNVTSGVWVSDSQSGFRAFSGPALHQLFFQQGGFTIESEMQFLAREANLRVIEVPIKVIYAEPAKRSPVRHGLQVLNGLMQLVGQTRPLMFFGGSGFIILLSGMLLGLNVVDIYMKTKVLAIGYALITIMFCVIGMLLFFAGIILHSTRGMFVELRRALFERLGTEVPTQVTQVTTIQQDELVLEVGK